MLFAKVPFHAFRRSWYLRFRQVLSGQPAFLSGASGEISAIWHQRPEPVPALACSSCILKKIMIGSKVRSCLTVPAVTKEVPASSVGPGSDSPSFILAGICCVGVQALLPLLMKTKLAISIRRSACCRFRSGQEEPGPGCNPFLITEIWGADEQV